MNTVIKHIISRTYKPLLVRYLSKTRMYRYKNIRLAIAPEVFHPGFFFSTQLLLHFINKMPLKEKSFLELGCGSGLISIVAAKQGAIVTATDINPIAIDFLKKNSYQNNVNISTAVSDLFKNIPVQQFDIIAVNPPYYKKQPVTAKDYAWFCGENGEYFSSFFKSLPGYIHQHSEVLMILFDGCDIEMINNFAGSNGFSLTCVFTKQNMLEKNFIFKITKEVALS